MLAGRGSGGYPGSMTETAKRPLRARSLAEQIEEHHQEEGSIASRLNWLRAGVLGANDGIVSTAALVVGVAAATTDAGVIATAGFAGLAAGALSMGVGEYVSVSSQRDAEKAQLERERSWHHRRPRWELEQLVRLNMETGMSEKVARLAAQEQTDHDPVSIHARLHLGIDPNEVVRPGHAALASLVSFTVGGAIPLLTMLPVGPQLRVPLTFAGVLAALALTGLLAAVAARAGKTRSIIRNLVGGSLAMAITYGVGTLIGLAV